MIRTRSMGVAVRGVVLALAAGLAFGTATWAVADSEQATLLDLQRDFSRLDMARTAYVSERMALRGEAALTFWPAYQDYLRALARLRDQQLQVLLSYAQDLNDDSLSAEQAARSLSESLRLERERNEVRQALIERFADHLTPQQRLRLYQLELIIEAQIRAELLNQIPLAK